MKKALKHPIIAGTWHITVSLELWADSRTSIDDYLASVCEDVTARAIKNAGSSNRAINLRSVQAHVENIARPLR